jgi:NAD(P)-dependent dehydrogenase (short-subunit alcohol dehydrogenase family)
VKAAVVTGAAGGLGSAVVELLAARGTGVLAVDLDEERLEALAGGAGDVVAHVADTTDAAAVEAYTALAARRFGRLDAVFNNAAIEGPVLPISEYPDEEFERVLRVNLKSTWLGTKHAVPALAAAGGGSIVNTASTGGVMGWPELSAYVASKHAVVGLTRAVALECAGSGVRVNALCPGPMDTRMIWAIGESMAPGDPDEQRRRLEATVPLGRLGRPEEVAAFAVWLLLDAPEYLTGAVLPVDGAQTAG